MLDALLAAGGAALGGAMGQLGSAAGQTLWGGITSGNWGGTSKERQNVITDTRKLRKTAYQDMVYSLKEAGLNPMLAVGAQPGYASAQQVQQYYESGNPGFMQAANTAKAVGLEEERNPSEIGKNIADARLRNQQQIATQLGIPAILQQYEINQAMIDQISATTGKIRGETSNLALMAAVLEAQAKTEGASARNLDEKTEQYRKFGMPGQSLQGAVRQILTDDKTISSAATLLKLFGFDIEPNRE